ncbi:MAG: SMC family ATPase, partial [Clostridiales bacterium]|nr:SMC family ATPase [Clostridiales bacterium]
EAEREGARVRELEAWQKSADALTLEEKRLQAARDTYLAAADAARQTRQTYETQHRLFLDEQAGVLAQTLAAGEPCPVCGSREHPAPAPLSAHAPDRAALDALRLRAERLEGEAAEKSARAATLAGAVEEARRGVEDQAARLFPGEQPAGQALPMRAADLLAVARGRNAALTADAAKARADAQRARDIREGIPRAEAKLTEQETIRRAAEALAVQKTTEAEALAAQCAQERALLLYDGRAAAEAALRALEARRDAWDKALTDAQAAFDEAREGVRQRQAALETLRGQLTEAPAAELPALTAQKAEGEAARAALLSDRQTVAERRNGNQSAMEALSDHDRKAGQLEKRRAWLSTLAQTVNGELRGRERILLETYVQTTYLDRVLARANTRLMRMSGGQYELTRRAAPGDLRSRSGLELDVIDHYNGSERDVKTLSGGEQFKASLALALGMSDEVQSSAGGVRLDTLLIDEGFGTLDEDSLTAAIDVLASLSEGNRLVGVISHVQQLKDRIDRQIVVTKTRAGGSRVEIRV